MYTKKETMVLQYYDKMFIERHFDEFDMIGFFIFIRSFIDKGDYADIYTICDTVAHRERDNGPIHDGVCGVIENNYQTITQCKKELKGARGIKTNSWNRQWYRLAQKLDLHISDEVINDISLCVVSMLQDTRIIENGNIIADLQIIATADGVGLGWTEGNKDSFYVWYFNCHLFRISNLCNGIIEKAVYTIREGDILRLVCQDGTYIV